MATSHIAFATTYTGDGWHDGYTDGRADCLANQPNDAQVNPRFLLLHESAHFRQLHSRMPEQYHGESMFRQLL
jgi:hypothetical protein